MYIDSIQMFGIVGIDFNFLVFEKFAKINRCKVNRLMNINAHSSTFAQFPTMTGAKFIRTDRNTTYFIIL